MELKFIYKVFLTLAIVCLAIFLTVRYRFTPPAADSIEVKKKEPAVFNYDFEQSVDLQNYNAVSDLKAKSGTRSAMLNDTIEFSTTFSKKLIDIPDFKRVKEIQVELEMFSESNIKDAVLVLAIDDSNGKSLHWSATELFNQGNQWNRLQKVFPLVGAHIKENATLKIYVWNKQKEKFFVDDLKVIVN